MLLRQVGSRFFTAYFPVICSTIRAHGLLMLLSQVGRSRFVSNISQTTHHHYLSSAQARTQKIQVKVQFKLKMIVTNKIKRMTLSKKKIKALILSYKKMLPMILSQKSR
uniref:Uncharacterized protein n=1 Tax=Cacopsylla melanoneura TaxID=428564 RepID=A0A8D8Q9I1_9HEMI